MKKILFILLLFISSNSYSACLAGSSIGSDYVYCGSEYFPSVPAISCNYTTLLQDGSTSICPAFTYSTAIPLGYDECTGSWDYLTDTCNQMECPPPGEKRWLEECSSVNTSTASSGSVGIGSDGNGTNYDIDGCGYSTTPEDANSNGSSSYEKKADGTEEYCVSFPYTSTGEHDADMQGSDKPMSSFDEPVNPNATPPTTEQQYTKQSDPPTTTSEPDGTQTTSQKDTETLEKPTDITNSPSGSSRVDGEKVVKTTTVTTVTNPDGSTSTNQLTGISNTTGSEISHDKSSGTLSVKPSTTSTSSTSTTTNTDSLGTVTGVTSTSTGGAGTDNGSIIDGNDSTSEETSDDSGSCDTAEENCEDFKEIIEDAPTINAEGDNLNTLSDDYKVELDGHDDVIRGKETWFSDSGISTTLGDTFSSLVPSGSCADYSLIAGPISMTLSCSDSAFMRDIFGYILYLLMRLFLFELVTTPVRL